MQYAEIDHPEHPHPWLQLVLIAFLVCARTVAAQWPDWSQFQGNPAHTGYVPVSFDPANLTLAWTAPAPAIPARAGERGVAIDAHRVYAMMPEGPNPYHVKAFDLRAGTELWRASIRANSHVSAPSVMGDRLYVHHFGHSGSPYPTPLTDYPALIGLNARTGAQEFFTTHDGQWDSGSRPTPIGSQVFSAGGYFGGLDGYDAQAGALRWRADVPMQYGWSPAADDRHVYVYMGAASASPGPDPARLYVFNRADLTPAFQILHPESERTHYWAMQNVVLGGRDDAFSLTFVDHPALPNAHVLVAFDLGGRRVKWQLPGDYTGHMAVGNGLIAIPENTRLAFIDQETGNRLWHWDFPPGEVTGNVVMTDTHAFVSTAGGVHAINLLTRTSDWNNPAKGELALAHGVLVVSNPQGVTTFAVPEPTFLPLLVIAALTRRPRRQPASIDE